MIIFYEFFLHTDIYISDCMPKYTLCVRMYVCKYVYMYMYVCMYDVRHDIQIPCTRYVAIYRLYLYLFYLFSHGILPLPTLSDLSLSVAASLSSVWRDIL